MKLPDSAHADSESLLASCKQRAWQETECDARQEPVAQDVVRSLQAESPASAEMADLVGMLLRSSEVALEAQDALQRALRWVEQSRKTGLDVSQLTLQATLESSALNVTLHCDNVPVVVWPFFDSTPDTLWRLRPGSFLLRTGPELPTEHWALEQARCQLCGVLSRSLQHVVECLRTVVDVRVQDWPVYRRVGSQLELVISSASRRVQLLLRQELVAAQQQYDDAQALFAHLCDQVQVRPTSPKGGRTTSGHSQAAAAGRSDALAWARANPAKTKARAILNAAARLDECALEVDALTGACQLAQQRH